MPDNISDEHKAAASGITDKPQEHKKPRKPFYDFNRMLAGSGELDELEV